MNYSNHCLLRNKNQGASKVLTGDVIVIVFYLNDAASRWNDAALKEYRARHDEAMELLRKAAARRGVFLRLRTASCILNLKGECSVRSDAWVKEAMRLYKKENASAYQEYFEGKHHCDEAPIIFAINKTARSFACNADSNVPNWDEFSVVMRDQEHFTATTIVHELLHQFGAVDYYYPETVYSTAKAMLPGSVMGTGGSKIDPLTEYLIGWCSDLTWESEMMLNITQGVTDRDIRDAIAAEWKKEESQT